MSSFPVQREAKGVSSVAGSQAQAEGLARSQSVPLSHPQQAGGHTLGFFRTGATWRPLPAIYQPPQPPKAPPPIPLPFQRSMLGPRAQACPWHGSRLPSLTSGSSAMRKVAIQRGGTRSPVIARTNSSNLHWLRSRHPKVFFSGSQIFLPSRKQQSLHPHDLSHILSQAATISLIHHVVPYSFIP